MRGGTPTRRILTVAVDSQLLRAIINMYKYLPPANLIDTPFTGVAVDAVDILRTLLGLTVPPLPLVVLACAEGINRFYWGS